MTNKDFIILAEKVAEGSATLPEIALYNAGYDSFQQDQQSLAEMGFDPEVLKQESLSRFWNYQPVTDKPIIKLWPRIAMVAAVMAVIVLGAYFFNISNFSGKRDTRSSSYTNDIGPGRNTATITLANGKTLNLSDVKTGVVIGTEKFAYNDGTKIKAISATDNLSAADKELLTVSTPRGGTYQVTLPDGTKVWLNAASSLKFLAAFNHSKDQQRKVELVGEAYFEVAKDKTRPFVVESKGQQVRVLGTHFNICSYDDEIATRTTLLEGSVKINEAILKPGEQSVLTGRQLKIVPADIENTMAWKNGDFVFKDEDFKTTMRKIARWYDVDVQYEADLKDNIELGGWISRKSKLSDVLKRIELAGNIHFKIEGRTIIVEK
ncbi:FecR family protein [Pedobacter nyackensis]|uniref:FecR family protein n=1 Tax=Pedobacter nyackensis TaxID=475255 RepID=UPI0029319720|nr:FecR domain-containing protein [Pedobacter nyackensis]